MMAEAPYARFARRERILRDELAIDRTVSANERTLLAYVRTALTLIIAGATFIQFIESGALRVAGFVAVPAGLLVGLAGFWRCGRMAAAIRLLRNAAEPPAGGGAS